jgi:hypothetical protein
MLSFYTLTKLFITDVIHLELITCDCAEDLNLFHASIMCNKF